MRDAAVTRTRDTALATVVDPDSARVVTVQRPGARRSVQLNVDRPLRVEMGHDVCARAVAQAPKKVRAVLEAPPVAVCTTRVAPAGTTPVLRTVRPATVRGVAIVSRPTLGRADSAGAVADDEPATPSGAFGAAIGVYVNRPAPVPVPLAVVTSMATVPAACGGATAVMLVGELTVKDVALTPPNVTAVAPVKPVPVMVTEVPPESGPLAGATEVTVGGIATLVLMSTDTPDALSWPVTRSLSPSPFMSAAATEYGVEPTGIGVAVAKLPSPFPSATLIAWP